MSSVEPTLIARNPRALARKLQVPPTAGDASLLVEPAHGESLGVGRDRNRALAAAPRGREPAHSL